jgi:hypothetical protein
VLPRLFCGSSLNSKVPLCLNKQHALLSSRGVNSYSLAVWFSALQEGEMSASHSNRLNTGRIDCLPIVRRLVEENSCCRLLVKTEMSYFCWESKVSGPLGTPGSAVCFYTTCRKIIYRKSKVRRRRRQKELQENVEARGC